VSGDNYDTPIADLLGSNRSRLSKRKTKMKKHRKKTGHTCRGKTKKGKRKCSASSSSNENNEGKFISFCSPSSVSCVILFLHLKLSVMFVSIFLFFFTFYLTIIEYYFSNYYQYLLDYPSGSEEDDSDFVVEEPHEAQENDSHVIDSDMVLSSSVPTNGSTYFSE